MVARVDAALKDELGIADGLADPNVYVLDPCCGTGAYLIEVLHHIADTLRRRDGEALTFQPLRGNFAFGSGTQAYTSAVYSTVDVTLVQDQTSWHECIADRPRIKMGAQSTP